MARKLGWPYDYFWRVRSLLCADTLLLRKSHHPSSHWVLFDAVSGLPCVGIRSVFVGMALGTLMSPALGGPLDFFTS